MLEHKRIFWQFEVEGAFDEKKVEEKIINVTVEAFQEASNQVSKVVRKVSTYTSKILFQQKKSVCPVRPSVCPKTSTN